jgi:uncharacterized protein (TIGR02246 family)
MRDAITSVRTMMMAVVLLAGWTVYAQVQDKSKGKPAPAKKTEAETAKKTDAGAKKPAPAKTGETKTKTRAADDKADKEEADRKEILDSAEKFVQAYNAQDAKSVAELFAVKAELTDEAGNLIQGREAIEQDFAKTFAEHPKCRVEVEVGSIRVLTPHLAVEEGIVHGQPDPDAKPHVSSYVAVHVKVEGEWKIASVSDFHANVGELTPHDRLQELAWMVGDWHDESSDAIVKTSCQWDDSGNYLLHEFKIQIDGAASASGSMRIGWDPLSRQIKSWTFDANGSYAEGLWTRIGDEWVVKVQGVNAEGQVTSAVNVFRFVNSETMTLRSYDRVVGGQPTVDIPENVVKRSPPTPAG